MEIKKIIPELLLEWYRENGRSYVWRRKKNPYEILIAEIMLQRTRADQVEPVYLDFIEKFPDTLELRKATEKEIGEYFGRLGLLWRAKLVKRLAEELVGRFEGKIPESRNLLLSLPTVGEYIADAVLCFAYGKEVAVVDANVCRIVERMFGITPKGEARRDRRFRNLAQEMVPPSKANEFNWAMIDFAALVCTSRNPKHGICPINGVCSYFQDLKGAKE
ncbi:MAG: DNA glycosylase [Candidatus Aenigmarchaeota archaeon]|nr:DNA glycosylase [Candidatus Aenigmarchaeota archaeon]